MKDLVCIQDLMEKALETKYYFWIKSLVAGLPHVMDKWICADDLVEKAAVTNVSATVQGIVANLPKFNLLTLLDQSSQKVEELSASCPTAESEEEPEL